MAEKYSGKPRESRGQSKRVKRPFSARNNPQRKPSPHQRARRLLVEALKVSRNPFSSRNWYQKEALRYVGAFLTYSTKRAALMNSLAQTISLQRSASAARGTMGNKTHRETTAGTRTARVWSKDISEKINELDESFRTDAKVPPAFSKHIPKADVGREWNDLRKICQGIVNLMLSARK